MEMAYLALPFSSYKEKNNLETYTEYAKYRLNASEFRMDEEVVSLVSLYY